MISDRIFSVMAERGMSQKQFSEQTGIPQSTISDWKNKRLNPAADKLLTICDVLKVSPYTLLEDEGKKTRNQTESIVVDKNSEDYMIVEMARKLDEKDKMRLQAYMQGLLEKY